MSTAAYPYNRFIILAAYGVLALAVLGVWGFVVGVYFFQDDFFLLATNRVASFTDLVHHFRIRPDVVYYRPLSMQLWYGLGQLVWGKQPELFHTIVLLLHLVNTFLVWRVIRLITGNRYTGFVAALLYGTALLHFIALVWIAEFSLVAITTIFLAMLLFWIRWINTGNRAYLVHTYLLFGLGLLTHELATVLPLLLGWIATMFFKVKPVRLRALALPTVLSVVYILVRLFVFHQERESSYQMQLGLDNVKILFWYTAWSLNIPEEMVRQVDSLVPFVVNAQFQKDFATEMIAMRVLAGVLSGVLLFGIFTKVSLRTLVGFLGWFVIGLGPFLVLPGHAYPMYATVGSIGLFGALGSLAVASRKAGKPRVVVLSTVLLATWIVAGALLLRFTYLTHWTIKVAGLAEEYIRRVSSISSILPSGAVIKFPDEKSLRFALMGDHGVKVMVREDLKVAYSEKEIQNKESVYTVP